MTDSPSPSKATKAISYLRYSTKEQSKGGSEKRQLEWTREYCEKKKLTLVDTYQDLGISAHRGKHSKEGKLAKLLKDCESGKIPQGYALIIENFDRLSREEVPVALQRFLTLINEYGLEIHTLDDNRIYAPGKIDLTELIITIVIMGRAHSESARRSVFSTKAWEQVREAERPFSKPGKNPLGRHPNWLNWDSKTQKWVKKTEAVTTIKYIFDLATTHKLGRYQVARRLQEEGVPVFSKRATKWTAAMIKRITNNRSLLGEFIPERTKDKDAVTIPDYYPEIITPKVFEKCLRASKSRNSHTTGRPTTNTHQFAILTGIGYYLDHRIHKGYYKLKSTGKVKSTYTALVNTKNLYIGFADHLEHFVCSVISELDDAELSVNSKNKAHEIKLETQLSEKRDHLINLRVTEHNLTEALKIAGDSLPSIVKQMQSNQHDILLCNDSIANIEQQLLELTTGSGVHDREKVAKLKKEALETKDLQSRQDMQVTLKQLIKRLDLSKTIEDLPLSDLPLDEVKITDQALMLHVMNPIKFWAKVELFNGAIILGAMTADGQIARIRWEDE